MAKQQCVKAACPNRTYATEPERLVDTYADTILRVCYTYLRSTQDAEDICQDVLLKVLQRPQRFFSADHVRAWIIRVAANACKDLLKSRGARATVALDDASEPASAPYATEAQLAARSQSVLQSVMNLPAYYREAIYLHYYEGYSIKQIAELAGASESAIATRLSRGRAMLRPVLEGADHDNL